MQVVYGQIKQIKSQNYFIKLSQDNEQLKINSNVDVERQTVEIYNCHWRNLGNLTGVFDIWY